MKDIAPLDIVLIGGGHANVAVLRHFAMHPNPRVRLTLVSDRVTSPYSGMLPGFIAGHYTAEDIHIDLWRLCIQAGARFYRDDVIGLDREKQQVLCHSRPPVRYDYCAINVGITPSQLMQGATPVKPIAGFATRWQAILDKALQADKHTSIAVVGSGAGGVELALAIKHRLQSMAQVRVLSRSSCALASHDAVVQAQVTQALHAANIAFKPNTAIKARSEIDADDVFWVTEAAAPAWLATTGLALHLGFLRISQTLQSIDDPRIFAAGDCTHFDPRALPKAGVYAVRMGEVLCQNLDAITQGKPLKCFKPQRHVLALISLGDKRALISHPSWSLLNTLIPSAWIWRWKDWIDQRWMGMYR